MATQRGSRTTRPPANLLPVPAAAERLGCSEMHIYRLIAVGELDAVDIAQPGARRSKTRVRSDSIDDYIESRTRRAPAAASRGPEPAA